MSKEALKLALEALETCYSSETSMYRNFDKEKTDNAIAAIKEGLAQPAVPQGHEQEPVAGQCRFPGVAWSQCDVEHVRMVLDNPQEWKGYEVRYIYATPPQRKPLTDEQILTVVRDHYNPYQRPEISFARAIEAAHGIKG